MSVFKIAECAMVGVGLATAVFSGFMFVKEWRKFERRRRSE